MLRSVFLRAQIGVALLSISSFAFADTPPPPAPPGADLYKQFCANCHDHPTERIPAKDVVAKRSADEVVQALTSGTMRTQAAGLNMNERLALALFITGRPATGKLTPVAETNLCAAKTAASVDQGSEWNGWGNDLSNARFQPNPGLTAADVPKLKLKWAFGYRSTGVYGQPTVVGGRVYVSSSSGRIYSLDARTGCTNWTFDAQAPSRTAIYVTPINDKPAAIFGDDSATLYALDATSGKLIWKQRLDDHVAARISGAPVAYGQRVYVPVSSLEELSAATPGYECCKFRGSVAALDASTGKLVWQTYTIDEKPKPYRKAKDGTQLYGPAGGAVWSAPTLDPNRNLIYVGTGNSYTDRPAPRTDSILALDMASGAIRWVNQLHEHDNYIVGCDSPQTAGKGNCPEKLGPDVDFGTSPILRTLPGGQQVLLTGQKSGHVHGLDPANGKQLWVAKVGAGSSLGGIEWGGAADATRMYVAVSDIAATTGKPGGLTALDISDGKEAWRRDPPAPVCSWGARNCDAAQSQAVSVMPGVVFSGSHDGHLRAYSAGDGRVVWDFDTGQPFETVNGVAAAGGSLDHGGATIAGGRVFVNSGYGRIIGQPGNVLLAFEP